MVQQPDTGAARVAPELRDGSQGWRSLDQLNQLIAGTESRVAGDSAAHVLAPAAGARQRCAAAGARPLLLVEDPETRLHPIMLSVAWNLLALMPLQNRHH